MERILTGRAQAHHSLRFDHLHYLKAVVVHPIVDVGHNFVARCVQEPDYWIESRARRLGRFDLDGQVFGFVHPQADYVRFCRPSEAAFDDRRQRYIWRLARSFAHGMEDFGRCRPVFSSRPGGKFREPVVAKPARK